MRTQHETTNKTFPVCNSHILLNGVDILSGGGGGGVQHCDITDFEFQFLSLFQRQATCYLGNF